MGAADDAGVSCLPPVRGCPDRLPRLPASSRATRPPCAPSVSHDADAARGGCAWGRVGGRMGEEGREDHRPWASRPQWQPGRVLVAGKGCLSVCLSFCLFLSLHVCLFLSLFPSLPLSLSPMNILSLFTLSELIPPPVPPTHFPPPPPPHPPHFPFCRRPPPPFHYAMLLSSCFSTHSPLSTFSRT